MQQSLIVDQIPSTIPTHTPIVITQGQNALVKSSLSLPTMFGLGAASFGMNAVNAFSNSVLPLLLSAPILGFSPMLVGLLAQERSLLAALFQPFIGMLSDHAHTRIGKRIPFFVVGAPLTAIALLLLAYFPSRWTYLLILPILGCFLAIAADPHSALIVDVTTPKNRAKAGGVVALCNMAGQATLLYLASQLFGTHPHLVFEIMAALMCGTFLITSITAYRHQKKQGGFHSDTSFSAEKTPMMTLVERRAKLVRYGKELWDIRTARLYTLTLFTFWLGNGAAVPFLTTFAVKSLHATAAQSYLLVFTAVISAAIFAVPAGYLGTHFGKKRVLSWGLGFFSLVALVGSQAQTLTQGIVIMVCLGIANALVLSLMIPLLGDIIPKDRCGELTGFASLVWSIAQPLGAVAAGYLIGLTGGPRIVFEIAGLFFVFSWLSLLRVDFSKTNND